MSGYIMCTLIYGGRLACDLVHCSPQPLFHSCYKCEHVPLFICLVYYLLNEIDFFWFDLSILYSKYFCLAGRGDGSCVALPCSGGVFISLTCVV